MSTFRCVNCDGEYFELVYVAAETNFKHNLINVYVYSCMDCKTLHNLIIPVDTPVDTLSVTTEQSSLPSESTTDKMIEDYRDFLDSHDADPFTYEQEYYDEEPELYDKDDDGGFDPSIG